MASDPKIRASDADRDRTAAALREHLAAGRLTTEEFDERLDKAYAAKTLGELDDLMADLPRTDLSSSLRMSPCTTLATARRCPGSGPPGRLRPVRAGSPRRGGRPGGLGSGSVCCFS